MELSTIVLLSLIHTAHAPYETNDTCPAISADTAQIQLATPAQTPEIQAVTEVIRSTALATIQPALSTHLIPYKSPKSIQKLLHVKSKQPRVNQKIRANSTFHKCH